MHGSIRDRLEDLLAARNYGDEHRELLDHLSSCGECAAEFAAIRGQADLLRTLRAPVEAEPSGGFYARVMQRIEEGAKDSIWAIFIYSPFGKRLTLASLALALLFCGYVVSSESQDGHLGGGEPVMQARGNDFLTGDAAHQRDAVLVNFVSTRETVQ